VWMAASDPKAQATHESGHDEAVAQLFKKRVAADHAHLVQEVMFTEAQIRTRAQEMAEIISQAYRDGGLEAGEEVIVVGLLKGALPFMHELVSYINIPVILDYIAVHSYGAVTESSGEYNFRCDMLCDPEGKHVLVVDDILDTGGTLQWTRDHVLAKSPKSVKLCVMLDKKERRTEKVEADFVGFDIPNKFVVGFGLDFDQKYRNLPFVAVLHPDAYQK